VFHVPRLCGPKPLKKSFIEHFCKNWRSSATYGQEIAYCAGLVRMVGGDT